MNPRIKGYVHERSPSVVWWQPMMTSCDEAALRGIHWPCAPLVTGLPDVSSEGGLNAFIASISLLLLLGWA